MSDLRTAAATLSDLALYGGHSDLAEAALAVRAALASPGADTMSTPETTGQPLFWYRPCSDGNGWEGPVDDARLEPVRKKSGAWVPLYAALAQPQQAAPDADLRTAARNALMALEDIRPQSMGRLVHPAIVGLRDALGIDEAAPAGQAAAPEFDHDIGADRFKVVKGSYWWHVRIGDGAGNVGKFHSETAAQEQTP